MLSPSHEYVSPSISLSCSFGSPKYFCTGCNSVPFSIYGMQSSLQDSDQQGALVAKNWNFFFAKIAAQLLCCKLVHCWRRLKLRFFHTFDLTCAIHFSKQPKNLWVKFSINRLDFLNEFLTHHSFAIEKQDKHYFDFWKRSSFTQGDFGPTQAILCSFVTKS